MRLTAIIHRAEEGGFWAEVSAIPGCATQGETREELIRNLHEAVQGCLTLDVELEQLEADDEVVEIAV